MIRASQLPRRNILSAGSAVEVTGDGDSNSAVTGSWMRIFESGFAPRGMSTEFGTIAAVAGHTWLDGQSRLASLSAGVTGSFPILLLMFGTNDLSPEVDNQSAAVAYARAEAYVTAALALEFRHLVIMEIPDHAGITAKVNEYNSLLRGLQSGRVSIVPRVPQTADSSNLSNFFPDGIHINTATCAVPMREAALDVMQRRL